MSGKRLGGFACLAVAILFGFGGIRSLVDSTHDPSGLAVSTAIGGLMPAVLFLALGIWLLSARDRRSSSRDTRHLGSTAGAVICRECGISNKAGARYCGSCGKML